MNTKQLEAFIGVMDEGSLSGSASKLNLSLPAVSRLIQLLEEHLQVRLFYREHRRLVPTREAELFYAEAQRVVAAIDDFPLFLQQMRERNRMPLRIICQLRAAAGLVVPTLELLATEMPDTGAVLDVIPRQELGRSLQTLKYDVGIFVLPVTAAQIAFDRVLDIQQKVLVAKTHPLSRFGLVSTQDLSEHPYVALKRGLLAREAVDRAVAQTGLALQPHYEVSSPAAAHSLVAAGLGFTFSDWTALEPQHATATSFIEWDGAASLQLGVHVSTDSPAQPAAQRFMELLGEIWIEMTSPKDGVGRKAR